MADVDLLVVQKHAIDGLNSSLCSLGGLVVHKSVAFGTTLIVCGDLAGQDITESSKGIVEGLSWSNVRIPSILQIIPLQSNDLIINGLVQVLDEDVALAGLAQGRVPLGPHNAASNVISWFSPQSDNYEAHQGRFLMRE